MGEVGKDPGHVLAVRLSRAEYQRLLAAAVELAKSEGGRISVGGFMREAALAAALVVEATGPKKRRRR